MPDDDRADGSHDALASVTLARLLASQGDRGGARRVLRAVLARDPASAGARALLVRLGGAPPRSRVVARLTAWLAAIRRGHDADGCPAAAHGARLGRRDDDGGAS